MVQQTGKTLHRVTILCILLSVSSLHAAELNDRGVPASPPLSSQLCLHLVGEVVDGAAQRLQGLTNRARVWSGSATKNLSAEAYALFERARHYQRQNPGKTYELTADETALLKRESIESLFQLYVNSYRFFQGAQ